MMEKYSELKRAFERAGNAEKAKQMSAYMRNMFTFYGVPTPEQRECCKSLLRDARKAECIDWELLEACWADKHREMQYFVCDYLDTLQERLTFDDVPRLERFVRSKQWWDTIDALDAIIGRIGLRDKRIDALMLEWSVDPDFWVRRVAIDHQLDRKKRTDTALLEAVIVNNFGSREFFINKAIGWSLREYSKTDPQWVADFIARHKDEMSPLSVREGSKRLR